MLRVHARTVFGVLMEGSDPLEVLLAELRRLRADGVETIGLSDESQAILRGLSGRAVPAPTARASTSVAGAPSSPAARPSTPIPPEATAYRREPVQAPAPKRVAQAPKVDDSAVPEPPAVEAPRSGTKTERLAALEAVVQACPECRRHLKSGAQPIFGAGHPEADIVFVGEAPGEEDERAGQAFVGPTGELLDRAIKAMGLSRDRVYVTHVMKWRPETPTGFGSRTPTTREMSFCSPYLRAQLAIIRPKVVVALGGTVFHTLTGDAARITEARGHWREVDGLPLLPTFHPSYLLKNPSQAPKRQFWEDLLAVMEKVGMPISEKQRGFFR